MKVNPLEIIYCKNCKYYKNKIVNKYSSIHECTKGNSVAPDQPELFCNKPCYVRKLFNKKKKEKA